MEEGGGVPAKPQSGEKHKDACLAALAELQGLISDDGTTLDAVRPRLGDLLELVQAGYSRVAKPSTTSGKVDKLRSEVNQKKSVDSDIVDQLVDALEVLQKKMEGKINHLIDTITSQNGWTIAAPSTAASAAAQGAVVSGDPPRGDSSSSGGGGGGDDPENIKELLRRPLLIGASASRHVTSTKSVPTMDVLGWLLSLPEIGAELGIGYELRHVLMMLLKGVEVFSRVCSGMRFVKAGGAEPPDWLRKLSANEDAVEPETLSQWFLAAFLYTVNCSLCNCRTVSECRDRGKDHYIRSSDNAHPDAHGHRIEPWAVMNWALRVASDEETLQAKGPACREMVNKTVQLFAPFTDALRSLLCALPQHRGMTYRGITVPVATSYKLGTQVLWSPFSSTSLGGKVALRFMAKGKEGTFFIIRSHSAAMIDFLSWYQDQAEALLNVNTAFEVKSKMSRTLLQMLGNKFDVVTMVEVGDRPTPEEQIEELVKSIHSMTFVYEGYMQRYVEGRIASAPPPQTETHQLFDFVSDWLDGGTPYMLLLGSAGTGKTSAVLACLSHLVYESKKMPEVPILPVFVSLPTVKHLTRHPHALDNHVLQALDIEERHFAFLRQRVRLVLLLDSLDEVVLEEGGSFKFLLDLNPLCSKAKVLMSCRDEFIAMQGLRPPTQCMTKMATWVTLQFLQPFAPQDVMQLAQRTAAAAFSVDGAAGEVPSSGPNSSAGKGGVADGPASPTTIESNSAVLSDAALAIARKAEIERRAEELLSKLQSMGITDENVTHPCTVFMALEVVQKYSELLPHHDPECIAITDVYEAFLRGNVQTATDPSLTMSCMEAIAMEMLRRNNWHLKVGEAAACLEGLVSKDTFQSHLQHIPRRVEDDHDDESMFCFWHKSVAEYLCARALWNQPAILRDVRRCFSQEAPMVITLFGMLASCRASNIDRANTIFREHYLPMILGSRQTSTNDVIEMAELAEKLPWQMASNALALTCASRIMLDQVHIQGIRIVNANLHSATFEGVKLTGAVFFRCIIHNTCFDGAEVGNVSFLECDSGMPLQPLRFQRDAASRKNVIAISVPESGTPIFCAAENLPVTIFDGLTGSLLFQLDSEEDKNDGPVASLAASLDGNWLAIGHESGEVVVRATVRSVLRLSGLDRVLVSKFHAEPVEALAWSANSHFLVCGSKDEDISIVCPSHSEFIWGSRSGHTRGVSCVSVHPDGDVFVSGSADNTVKMWSFDKECADAMATHSRHELRVTGIACHHKIVASCGLDLVIMIATLPKLIVTSTLLGHLQPLRGVAISHDGGKLFSVSDDSTARLWSIATASPVATFGHKEKLTCVALAQKRGTFFTGTASELIYAWSVATLRPPRPIHGHQDTVTRIQLAPDGLHLVSASTDRQVLYWRLDNLRLIGTYKHPKLDIAKIEFATDSLARGVPFLVVITDDAGEKTCVHFSTSGAVARPFQKSDVIIVGKAEYPVQCRKHRHSIKLYSHEGGKLVGVLGRQNMISAQTACGSISNTTPEISWNFQECAPYNTFILCLHYRENDGSSLVADVQEHPWGTTVEVKNMADGDSSLEANYIITVDEVRRTGPEEAVAQVLRDNLALLRHAPGDARHNYFKAQLCFGLPCDAIPAAFSSELPRFAGEMRRWAAAILESEPGLHHAFATLQFFHEDPFVFDNLPQNATAVEKAVQRINELMQEEAKGGTDDDSSDASVDATKFLTWLVGFHRVRRAKEHQSPPASDDSDDSEFEHFTSRMRFMIVFDTVLEQELERNQDEKIFASMRRMGHSVYIFASDTKPRMAQRLLKVFQHRASADVDSDSDDEDIGTWMPMSEELLGAVGLGDAPENSDSRSSGEADDVTLSAPMLGQPYGWLGNNEEKEKLLDMQRCKWGRLLGVTNFDVSGDVLSFIPVEEGSGLVLELSKLPPQIAGTAVSTPSSVSMPPKSSEELLRAGEKFIVDYMMDLDQVTVIDSNASATSLPLAEQQLISTVAALTSPDIKDSSSLVVSINPSRKFISRSDLDWLVDIMKQGEQDMKQRVAPLQTEFDSLQAYVDKKMKDVAPQMEAAISSLNSLTKSSLNELKSFSNPPKRVAVVVQLLCIILGHDPSWDVGRRLLSQPDISQTLLNFDVSRLSPKAVAYLKKNYDPVEHSPDALRSASMACAVLASWIKGVMASATVMQSLERDVRYQRFKTLRVEFVPLRDRHLAVAKYLNFLEKQAEARATAQPGAGDVELLHPRLGFGSHGGQLEAALRLLFRETRAVVTLSACCVHNDEAFDLLNRDEFFEQTRKPSAMCPVEIPRDSEDGAEEGAQQREDAFVNEGIELARFAFVRRTAFAVASHLIIVLGVSRAAVPQTLSRKTPKSAAGGGGGGGGGDEAARVSSLVFCHLAYDAKDARSRLGVDTVLNCVQSATRGEAPSIGDSAVTSAIQGVGAASALAQSVIVFGVDPREPGGLDPLLALRTFGPRLRASSNPEQSDKKARGSSTLPTPSPLFSFSPVASPANLERGSHSHGASRAEGHSSSAMQSSVVSGETRAMSMDPRRKKA